MLYSRSCPFHVTSPVRARHGDDGSRHRKVTTMDGTSATNDGGPSRDHGTSGTNDDTTGAGHHDLSAAFEARRGHLRAVATRILGSTAEAEDAVQEAWLRLDRHRNERIDNLGGWLTRVVGRIGIDMLRSRSSRAESALDSWIDELVVTQEAGGPENAALEADALVPAMLIVLETLRPRSASPSCCTTCRDPRAGPQRAAAGPDVLHRRRWRARRHRVDRRPRPVVPQVPARGRPLRHRLAGPRNGPWGRGTLKDLSVCDWRSTSDEPAKRSELSQRRARRRNDSSQYPAAARCVSSDRTVYGAKTLLRIQGSLSASKS